MGWRVGFWTVAHACGALVLGCSGQGAGSDSSNLPTPDPGVGFIQLLSSTGPGSPDGIWNVGADFWRSDVPLCDYFPTDYGCRAAMPCVDAARETNDASAGTLRLTTALGNLEFPHRIETSGSAGYGDIGSGMLWNEGEPIDFSLTGDPTGVPALTGRLSGPSMPVLLSPPPQSQFGTTTDVDGQSALDIAWSGSAFGDVLLQVFCLRPELYGYGFSCRFPGSTSQATVPAEIMRGLTPTQDVESSWTFALGGLSDVEVESGDFHVTVWALAKDWHSSFLGAVK
jgi:hypothetical protein